MSNLQRYKAAAFALSRYGAANVCTALELLQQIPEAGPIFAQIESADEMLSHAVQCLHAKAAALEIVQDPAGLMALALPDPLERRRSWRPPGG